MKDDHWVLRACDAALWVLFVLSVLGLLGAFAGCAATLWAGRPA